MDFIDEQNHVAGFFDFGHHALNAFFEFAAVFGSGNHARKVERDHAFVGDRFGNDALGDLFGKAFHDRRFADARLTD